MYAPQSIRKVTRAVLPALVSVLFISFFITSAQLLGLLFTYNVYERVFSARNETTLLFLTIFVGGVWVFASCLETLRNACMNRVGVYVDRRLAPLLFDAAHRAKLAQKKVSSTIDPDQVLRDLDTVRDYIGGGSLGRALDVMWVPCYIFAAFLISSATAWFVLVILAVILVLGIVVQTISSRHLKRAITARIASQDMGSRLLRNSDAIRALGMKSALQERWKSVRDVHVNQSVRAATAGASLRFCLSVFMQGGPSFVLAYAAYLVIRQELSPTAAIVLTQLAGRCLGPVVGFFSNWRIAVVSYGSYSRLCELVDAVPEKDEHFELPRPTGHLTFENVSVSTPDGTRVLRDVSFECLPGTITGVIGPSGAGKSSLVKAMSGIWRPSAGTIRLDGADLRHWDTETLGRNLGYIPQDVELFDGSIAENISRFRSEGAGPVRDAAIQAGAHDMILGLKEGYDTQIGDGGMLLSGGQRQRVALARAIYGSPSLIIMDEPNANLDGAGEQALVSALRSLAAAGSTVVIVTHRGSVLSIVDRVLLLVGGEVAGFGKPSDVLSSLGAPKVVQLAPPTAKRMS